MGLATSPPALRPAGAGLGGRSPSRRFAGEVRSRPRGFRLGFFDFVFPLGDHGGGHGVADDVGGRADEEAADQWSLVAHNGGRALGHELVAYLDERVTYAKRWHGAIRDWDGALSLAWGLLDPVATTEVLAALRELRPGVPVDELAELGHYPQVEDPGRVAEALRAAVARAG